MILNVVYFSFTTDWKRLFKKRGSIKCKETSKSFSLWSDSHFLPPFTWNLFNSLNLDSGKMSHLFFVSPPRRVDVSRDSLFSVPKANMSCDVLLSLFGGFFSFFFLPAVTRCLSAGVKQEWSNGRVNEEQQQKQQHATSNQSERRQKPQRHPAPRRSLAFIPPSLAFFFFSFWFAFVLLLRASSSVPSRPRVAAAFLGPAWVIQVTARFIQPTHSWLALKRACKHAGKRFWRPENWSQNKCVF